MQYIPPADGPGPYEDPNPGTGFEGSQLPANVFEHPQQEILNAIIAAGLTPLGADLTQLGQAITQFIRNTGATTTAKGSVERATQTEVNTGTDDTRYITPAKLKALLDSLVRGRLVAIIKDVKGNGVDGGTFSNVGIQTRTLNTLVDPFGLVSLDNGGAGPGFTLPALPLVVRASAPGFRVRKHQVFLYTAAGSLVERGTSEYADNLSANESEPIDIQTRSHVAAYVNPGSPATYEIRHAAERTQTGDGFGRAAGHGGEVYTLVEVWGA